MGILKEIFGPSKDEIWSQISRDIGGEFIDGGFWKKDVLVYQHGEWTILLDTYTVSNGKSSTTYTRMRAPFVNKDGTYFKVYREGFFSAIGKFFGMQDIEIGDAYFDDQFIIKGNNPGTLKELFADQRIKDLIHLQPRIEFEIKNDDGWFSTHFPEGVDQLYFSCVGIMKKTERLKALFELFSATLERLVEIDSAYACDPNIRVK